MDPNVGIIKLFPGITASFLSPVLSIKGLKGIVLETYGSGNAPTDDLFIRTLEEAIKKGVVMLNITQCIGGHAEQGRYATSFLLEEIGDFLLPGVLLIEWLWGSLQQAQRLWLFVIFAPNKDF